RHPRTGEHLCAVRDEEGAARRRRDRAPDETVRLHRGGDRPHAGGNAADHDPGGDPVSSVGPATVRPFERSLPPVTGLGMAALACAVVSGVVVASQVGMDDPPLVVPTVFVAAALLLEIAAVVVLVRIRPFAWDRFRLVFSVGLAAYVLQS